jgi:hypothetical protein
MITYDPSHFDLNFPELFVRQLRKRTKLPTSNYFFLTFGSLQFLVSSWYLYRLVTALSLSGSNKTFSMALLGHDAASVVVRRL